MSNLRGFGGLEATLGDPPAAPRGRTLARRGLDLARRGLEPTARGARRTRVALLFTLTLAALLLTSALAAAAPLVLHDGDRFSVTLRDGLRSCLASHDAAADPAACKEVARYPTLPPETADSRTFVVGVLWPGGATVVVTGTLVKMTRPSPEDLPQATELAKGMAEGAAKQLPGATVHGAPDVKLLDLAGLPVARVVVDLDGVPEDKSVTQHNLAFVVASVDGLYALSFASSAVDAAALESLASDVLTTLHVGRPASARASLAYSAGYLAGMLSVVLVAVVFGIVVAVRASSARRKAAAALAPGAPPGP